MPIPTYDQMLRPILALAAEGEISRRSVVEPVADHFGLTEQERRVTIPSGSEMVRNRCGWAVTFLMKAGLIDRVMRGQYRITADGHRYLREYPTVITVRDLAKQSGWKDAWGEGEARVSPETSSEAVASSPETPTELVERGMAAIRADLSERLLQEVLKQDPTFFEHLVLDVLTAMGYGSSNRRALHLGRSGDEGIDGCINQDPLGLDQIMVQAKRYAVDRAIDRHAVQAFVGSLAGQGVTKGVFITTSYFNENALDFVKRGTNTKVVLVDGDELVRLMMRHHIGVRVKESLELLELDQNYFDEE
jgi:restriction system protein